MLDTNVIASLINPSGAPSVKAWATAQPEHTLYLSVLTLGEYDKGIYKLGNDQPQRSRYAAARDALDSRFEGRILSVSDTVIRAWGRISGIIKLETGHAPSVIDTLLAATAIEHELFLSTRNVRDVSSSGAAIFNPWDDDPSEFPLS